ncbi:ribonuclease D [Collinsella sp. zg1085]|uniref:ribonuclease D n=1 Tax=Collinsella sp. zg1085 TaxID=2844380 RepID=UPI001C0B9748|nr:ribonuclease D [Collinsella sp. zg1085]QWT17999.1 ribonuclease D [Collinsella sp. zg1085]
MYISTTADLESFCKRATEHDAIAVDTEFIREKTFHPHLCLIQIATRDEVAIIDPLLIKDLSSLARLMANPAIMKVFHACSQDMEALYFVLDTLPAPLFDTQIAVAFLGERQQISYHALIKSYCQVELAKSESLTDWSVRPLSPSQLRYAAEDVSYLIQAFDVVQEQLREQGRMSWVLDELSPYTQLEHYVQDPRLAFLKMKRINTLTRRQLGIARELAAWRETSAEEYNIPRKWMLSDEVLIEFVRNPPRTYDMLRRVRGTERLQAHDIKGALDAVSRGLACPSEKLPHPPRPRHITTPERESVVDLMYALIRLVSKRSRVAASLIASRDDLLNYMDEPEKSPLRDGWRFELVGSLIDDLLQGNIGLTAVNGHLEIL